MSIKSFLSKTVPVAVVIALAACTPKYDWREIRGTTAPFVVVLPAKPSIHTRPVDLDGTSVLMTMTAAEAGGATFAVATAELGDAAQARKAVDAMKTAMVRNIGGSVRQERTLPVEGASAAIALEAVGAAQAGSKQRLLLARFIAKDRRVYQLVIVGHEGEVPQEAVDTFFTSFKGG